MAAKYDICKVRRNTVATSLHSLKKYRQVGYDQNFGWIRSEFWFVQGSSLSNKEQREQIQKSLKCEADVIMINEAPDNVTDLAKMKKDRGAPFQLCL